MFMHQAIVDLISSQFFQTGKLGMKANAEDKTWLDGLPAGVIAWACVAV
jgi:hypothetical protein